MKKALAFLLSLSLLLALCACGSHRLENTEPSYAEDTPAPAERTVEPEPEEVIEPEPEETVLTVTAATALSADELTPESGSGLLQNLYLPLLVTVDGETHSDVLAEYGRLGGMSYRLQVRDDLVDSEGNPFTVEDLAALLEGSELVADLTIADETSLTFTLNSNYTSDFEALLRGTYAVTRAAKASGSALPAGFGPYLVESIEDNVVTLARNEACPAIEDDPCTMALADKIILTCGVTAEEQSAALSAGTLEIACDLPAEGSTDFTGTCSFLVRSPSSSYDYNTMFALIDRAALAAELGQTAAEQLFAPDFPGAVNDYTLTTDKTTASLSVKLGYEADNETGAQALAEQLKKVGYNVTLKSFDNGTLWDSVKDWDIAYVTVTGATAPELISRLLAYDAETGTTRLGITDSNALQVAALLGSPYGVNETNLALLETWLENNSVLTGLTAETVGTTCGAAERTEAAVSSLGVLFGSAIPEGWEAPAEADAEAAEAGTEAAE